MGSASINGPQKQANIISEWVWFEGATALKEGQGVCYNWDYGTATAANAARFNRVELPTILNSRYFAGVAARNYSAKSGGQLIEIYKPGSVCNVLSKANSTIGVGILTCEAGGTYAGYFRYAGFEGEGSCVPLQTVDRSSTAGKCLARLQVGPPSGLTEVVTVVDNDAITIMVGGVTYVIGAAIGTGNCTATLADATIEGLRKRFEVITTAVTSNILNIDMATNGVQLDGSTALADIQLDAVGEEITVESCSGIWVTRGKSGATEA